MPKLPSKITLLDSRISLKTLLGRISLLFLLLFSYSSCTDQGCIEADDFGEYEQEILFVPANALGDSCQYDATKSLTDAGQGSGLKACLTSGNITVNDGLTTQDRVSTTGCSGFEGSGDEVAKSICIEQCRQNCINTNSSDASGSEPEWVSTHKKESGQNFGVTITPNSRIEIRAVGNVVLSGSTSSFAFARSSDPTLQSRNADFTPAFIDVNQGITKDIKFSGKWKYDVNSTNFYGGNASSTTSEDERIRAFEGGRRLAAYLVPHPAGYRFDTSQTSEAAGNRGVPLNVDTGLWFCAYAATSNDAQASCNSLPYDNNANNGYPNADNILAQSAYSITSTKLGDNFSQIGGIIRFDGDGTTPLSRDPFVNISCSPTCTSTVAGALGGMVGNLSNGNAIVSNTQRFAVQVALKNLSDSDSCSLNGANSLALTITNNAGVVIANNSLEVNRSSWTGAYIALEPGDKITFATNATKYSSSNINCGNVIAYKFNKLLDLPVSKSGFVSFTRLGISGSGDYGSSCFLKARIVNPKGSKLNFGNMSADFYEYDSFENPISSDPADHIDVPISVADPNIQRRFDKIWSNKIFVRKGQVIRISPSSWDKVWSSGNGDRQCGIGMAMQIEARPAFLCRGVAQVDVNNLSCKQSADSDGSISCLRYSDQCLLNPNTNQPNNANKYCPIDSCQDNYDDSTCRSTNPFTINSTTCANCKLAKDQAGSPNQQPTTQLSLSQCYDLENYRGKVANINANTGFSPSDLADPGISKGAKILGNFDGTSGNFGDFVDSQDPVDNFNSNKVYSLRQLPTMAYDGRLKFLVIDNSDFNQNFVNNYSNNTGNAQYNGLNGYKISVSGKQEYKNGQWLEVRLCQESGDDTYNCSSGSVPITDVLENGQPHIVRIADTTAATTDPVITSYYQFDPFGSIIRFNNPNALGPNPNSDPIAMTQIGDNSYRHSYQYVANFTGMSEDQINANKSEISRLRLSFKIKDPEIANCKIDSVTNPNQPFAQNCGANCDGIVLQNRFYDNTDSDNVNTICLSSQTPGNDSNQCQKQYFCANKYYNNEGKYQVMVRVENQSSNISDIVNKVISPVIEVMDGSADGTKVGQAERIYNGIVGDPNFRLIVQMLMVLMITFYGVGYLMGVSEFSQNEIISRIIRIGIIYLFISPDGWVWFDRLFVNLFRNGTDYVTFLMASSFDQSAEMKNAIVNNDFHDKSILFSGIDRVFGMFFSAAVQKKISALLFASIFGWAYLYIIYLSFFLYIYAVANAVLLYLTAQVFISVLFVLGPLFFLTLLFGITKDMFDKWLSQLIGFSLQQVFLLTTLAFFNMMMYEIMKMSLGYRICWDDVWVINIYLARIKLLSFWTIASLPPRMNAQTEVGNIGNPEGIPSFFSILFIWIIASLMHKFIGFMTDLGSSIGGSIKASELSKGIQGAGAAVSNQMKGMYKDKIGKHIDSAVGSVDRVLFDSGKEAEKKRAEQRAQNKTDANNRNDLAKAGDKAMSEFRKNNAEAYSKATPEEQRKMLSDARNKGIEKRAAEKGIKPEELKRLISTKASLAGATNAKEALQAAWQGRRNLNKTLNDAPVKTSFSGSEIKAALNKADAKGKAELLEAVKDGKLKVSTNFAQRAKIDPVNAAKEVGGKAKNAVIGAKNAFKAAPKAAINAVKNAPGAVMSAGKNALAAPGKAANAAGEAIGKAASDAGQALKYAKDHKVETAKKLGLGAVKAGADLISSPLKIVDKALTSKSEAVARQQLEAKGLIDKKSVGTRFMADNVDKALISAQVKKNNQQKQVDAISQQKNTKKDIKFVSRMVPTAITTSAASQNDSAALAPTFSAPPAPPVAQAPAAAAAPAAPANPNAPAAAAPKIPPKKANNSNLDPIAEEDEDEI